MSFWYRFVYTYAAAKKVYCEKSDFILLFVQKCVFYSFYVGAIKKNRTQFIVCMARHEKSLQIRINHSAWHNFFSHCDLFGLFTYFNSRLRTCENYFSDCVLTAAIEFCRRWWHQENRKGQSIKISILRISNWKILLHCVSLSFTTVFLQSIWRHSSARRQN